MTSFKNVEDLALELLKISSTTTHEKELSDYLTTHCKEMGFDRVEQVGKGNVVAVIDAGQGEILNFNGHMD